MRLIWRLAPRRRSPVGSRTARNELRALSQSYSRVDDMVLVLRLCPNPRAIVIARHRYTIPLTCPIISRPLQYDPIFPEAQMPLQGVETLRMTQGPHPYPSDGFWKTLRFEDPGAR